MAKLMYSPTIQRVIRQDPPEELGKPTRAYLDEAAAAGRVEEVKAWLDYLSVEIGGIHYLLSVWNWHMVRYYLERHGATAGLDAGREAWHGLLETSLAPWLGTTYGLAGQPQAEVAAEGTAATLTVHGLPWPVCLQEGEKRYHITLGSPTVHAERRGAWQQAVDEALVTGDAAAFQELLDRRIAEDRFIHDVLSDWCWALMTVLVQTWGEAALGEIQRATEEPWVTVRYAALRNLTPEESLQLSVEAHRGHFAGPHREGSVRVLDEADRYVIELGPCGSGGRMLQGDPTVGNGSRLLPPYNFAVIQGAYPWTWGRAGVGAYCSHCAIVNQILPIEWLGKPMRGTDFPADPREPCRWFIYKSADAVPEEQYASVGKARREDRPNGTPHGDPQT